MEKIYKLLWELAKPYYAKGRAYDIKQIEWMMPHAERIADEEGYDKMILLPLVILHDVGYAGVKDKNPNIKDVVLKKEHMKKGAEIAQYILEQVNYDPQLTKQIAKYISVHDNWVFGDHSPFQKDRLLAVFNDLDFLHVTSNIRMFINYGQSMGMTPVEFYDFWQKEEKLVNRPFNCQATKKMWHETMEEIKKDIIY